MFASQKNNYQRRKPTRVNGGGQLTNDWRTTSNRLRHTSSLRTCAMSSGSLTTEMHTISTYMARPFD